MNSIKTANQISNLTLRKWFTNPKIYILFILMAIVVYQPMQQVTSALLQNNLKISPFIFPFIMVSSYFKLVIIFGLILLFCDAPFKTPDQLFVISRTNKTTWVLGQVLYIIKGTFIYFGFIFICSFLYLLPYADFNSDWGTGIALLKDTGAITMLNLTPVMTEIYTPFWGTIHTLLLATLIGVFLALIMFVLNTVAPKFVGATIGVAFVLASNMAIMFGKWYLWVMPTSVSSLINLDPYGLASGVPKLWYAYLYLIVLNLILIWLSVRVTKKNLLGGAV